MYTYYVFTDLYNRSTVRACACVFFVRNKTISRIHITHKLRAYRVLCHEHWIALNALNTRGRSKNANRIKNTRELRTSVNDFDASRTKDGRFVFRCNGVNLRFLWKNTTARSTDRQTDTTNMSAILTRLVTERARAPLTLPLPLLFVSRPVCVHLSGFLRQWTRHVILSRYEAARTHQ